MAPVQLVRNIKSGEVCLFRSLTRFMRPKTSGQRGEPLSTWLVLVWGAAYFGQCNDAIKENFTKPANSLYPGQARLSQTSGSV